MVREDSPDFGSRYSGTPWGILDFAYEAFTLFGGQFHVLQLSAILPSGGPTTGGTRRYPLWALPLSLAATNGIIPLSGIFFSSGYLDVSVPRVPRPPKAAYPAKRGGFPHSETTGS